MPVQHGSRPPGRRFGVSPFVAGMLVAAGACAGLALVTGTETWAAWISHPAQPRTDVPRQGAILLRIMLGATAVTVVVAAAMLCRIVPPAAPATAGGPSPTRRGGLLGIVVVAIALRAWRLNESLWYDEIASWMVYAHRADSLGAVIGNFFDPINHPLHTLLNALSVRWFAEALGIEVAFRLPALIFSLLTIPAVLGLARALGTERLALIAAGLAAVLPVTVLAGTEARGYSMMIFFSAAMTWTLIEARRRASRWRWVVYALMCALGIWSQLVTAFVPIGHAVWVAWRALRYHEWREAAAATVALALGATVTVTLYAPMIPGTLAARDMFVTERGDEPTILGAEGVHALLQLGGSWYWWAAAPGLILTAVGLLVGVRRAPALHAVGPRVPRAPGAGVTMTGLLVMVLAVALAGTWIYARFTLFALPGAILLIAVGAESLWRWRRNGALVALGLIAACSLVELAIRPPKQPLRDSAEYVRTHGQAADRLLAVGLAQEVLRAYADGLDLTYSLGHGTDLDLKLALVRPVWLIVEFPGSVRGETYELIRRSGFSEVARLAGWMDWTNGDVIVYRKQ